MKDHFCLSVCVPHFSLHLNVQEVAAAERAKRQAQQERDELQDEINNQAAKK